MQGSRATFVTGWKNGQPDLPPMDNPEGGLQLSYIENDTRKGGFSVISGQHETSCVVAVHTSKETMDAMKNDAKYVFIEEVADAETV